MLIRVPRGWELPERAATPQDAYLDRRRFLGAAAVSALGGLAGALLPAGASAQQLPPPSDLPRLTAPRNTAYTVNRRVTSERIAIGYNNYYEFTEQKERVWIVAENFPPRPWQIEIMGHVEQRRKLDVDELIKEFALEERVYRHRCVEAWSMVIPWVGFPMKKFVEWCAPTSKAKFIRMVGFQRPGQAPGQRESHWYPWPYHEGLTLEEAMNELTLLTVGMYGRVLPVQNGSPLRLITPWKYGFKGIKGITRFEFVEKRPMTFWNTAVPREYDFWANVDPTKPHPRWSQATERVVETGERIPTLPFNGYEQYVAHLYKS
jgi:sulfoxide reductase catalytic subunit YedY